MTIMQQRTTRQNGEATCADGWVSMNDCAEYWSVSRDTIRRLVTERGIERRKVGRAVRIRRADMLALGTPVTGHDASDLDWDL